MSRVGTKWVYTREDKENTKEGEHYFVQMTFRAQVTSKDDDQIEDPRSLSSY